MLTSEQQKNISKRNGFAAGYAKSVKNSPFADIKPTASAHFELHFLAAVSRLTRQITEIYGTREAAFEEFPFLRIYDENLAGREPDDLKDENALAWWEKNLKNWEQSIENRLPLRDLREKFDFDFTEILLQLTIGLIEEDARFGAVFETINEFSTEKRLTFGTVNYRQKLENSEHSAQNSLSKLRNLGLINFGNLESPRSEWTLSVTPILWDILRGDSQVYETNWLKITCADHLTTAENLILNEKLKREILILSETIERGDVKTVILRGARHNSRKTILGTLARSLGCGVLEVRQFDFTDVERWKIINVLAVLLGLMPVFEIDVAPSETVEIPAIFEQVKALGIALGKNGGIGGEAGERAITLNIGLPDGLERQRHWRAAAVNAEAEIFEEISERFRLSGGNIRRAAKLAKSYAALSGHEKISFEDVRRAAYSLNRQSLDTLANYLEPLDGNWDFLAVKAETLIDLRQLEARCRIRENLRDYVGKSLRGQLQAGVRALFNGGSGTGKTYAARILAAELQKDIYRLDLSTIVNKYIGETEKNLARVFSLVEELDVILLLDEGDALLTQRTSVNTANDRYANLETNYLLQRLESFEGILIVTTNAGDRIDSAFQRRMDTVIEFSAPDVDERRRIWNLHLPEKINLPERFFEELVQRCKLTGGQIRNVVLHSASLALGENKKLEASHIESGVRREYRKIGATCPLREYSDFVNDSERW